MEITHITFDFWQTLFRSNPDYKVSVITAIKKYVEQFASINYEEEWLINRYEEIKKVSNEMEALTGVAVSATHRHMMFFRLIEVPISLVTEDYMSMLEEIFLKFPPISIVDNMIELLDEMNRSYHIGIISNTGMIPGNVLRQLFNDVEGTDINFIFSDEVHYAKPNRAIFNRALTQFSSIPKSRANWLHVGDDDICDIKGARDMGGRAFKIVGQLEWDNLQNILSCKG